MEHQPGPRAVLLYLNGTDQAALVRRQYGDPGCKSDDVKTTDRCQLDRGEALDLM